MYLTCSLAYIVVRSTSNSTFVTPVTDCAQNIQQMKAWLWFSQALAKVLRSRSMICTLFSSYEYLYYESWNMEMNSHSIYLQCDTGKGCWIDTDYPQCCQVYGLCGCCREKNVASAQQSTDWFNFLQNSWIIGLSLITSFNRILWFFAVNINKLVYLIIDDISS
jgi:hypothetical protein